jgi:predicted amidohydrolase YtcJ
MTEAADLVVRGQVLIAAVAEAAERAEAVAIRGDRVVATGQWHEVEATIGPATRLLDVRDRAVVPGLHDFHIHLVGLARTRQGIVVEPEEDGTSLLERVRRRAAADGTGAWVTGRGWTEAQMARATPERLAETLGDRGAYLTSHDGHSAWASPAALRQAGIAAHEDDPPGGRFERHADGTPNGVLRETAMNLVADHVPRLQGAALRPALEATVDELAALGITGATEAGDYTDRNGIGADAALGDSHSTLTDLADALDGRLRMTLGIPVDAIDAAAARGLRTGAPVAGRRTLRFGWAKEYADGALGSGTAALFEPRTCGDGGTGILRVTPDSLDDLFRRARPAGIGLAIHAIGDRAVATVLDAVGRAPARGAGVPDDRMEHIQLARDADRRRLAALGVTASVQFIHAAADRDLVESCWDGRQHDAYAWRALVGVGALLAAGSDAPVESVNPWIGVHAAVHRRFPDDPRPDWRLEQAIGVVEALGAYTLGPARALGARDEGHLRLGARADLAVLNVGLEDLLAAAVDFGAVRADMTLVDGVQVR